MKVFNDHLEYAFEIEGAEHHVANTYTTFELGWIPEDYSLKERVRDPFSYREAYQDKEGNSLIIWLVDMTMSGVGSSDIEDATVYQRKINGYNVTIYEKDYYNVVIPIPESRQVIQIIATSHKFSEEDIDQMISSLTIN